MKCAEDIETENLDSDNLVALKKARSDAIAAVKAWREPWSVEFDSFTSVEVRSSPSCQEAAKDLSEEMQQYSVVQCMSYVYVMRPGNWTVWLGGGFSRGLAVLVDGLSFLQVLSSG